MLREDFEAFLKCYLSDKKKYENLPSPKRLKDLNAVRLIENLEDNLKEASDLPANHIFQSSVGQTHMAEIPHLCVMDSDVTDTPQEGYYIVYLFSSDMSRIYLSLNQAWTQYKNAYGQKKKAQKALAESVRLAQHILEIPRGFYIDPISLNTDNELGIGYEMGHICSKMYEKGAIPSDDQLVKDLKRLIDVYQEMKGLVIVSTLNFNFQTGELDFQAKIQNSSRQKLPEGPIPLKKVKGTTVKSYWSRNPQIAAEALKEAGYRCEVDSSHKTFYSKLRSYMEAHHLVPMSFQDKFDHSIDVPENIICLCPTCHRAFHHADIGHRKDLVKKFYTKRKEGLLEREISIKLQELVAFYSSKRIEEEEE